MENTTSIDWSATAAWIALAVSIISPIITTIISNYHQNKMKKLGIIENRGLGVIENYLAVTSREILTLAFQILIKNFTHKYLFMHLNQSIPIWIISIL